jgi:nitrogen fixation/metabolism regulation signal transduction histidine kinase
VKKILDDHGAAIKLKNRSNEETGEILGASVEIVFKVSRLEHNPISN